MAGVRMRPSPAATPAAGRLPCVEACDDVDDLAIQSVVESIGEAREEGAPQAHRDLRKRLGHLCDEINHLLEGAHKDLAQAWALSVVPVTGQRHVGRRLRAEADSHS